MKHVLFLLFIVLSTSTFAQKKVNKVNWLTLEQAEELNKKEQRKFFIFVNTSWCSVCKRMEKNHFRDAEIVEKLNTLYYPIKFDAETKETVHFDGHDYKFKQTPSSARGVNEFAEEILQGEMLYPTIILLKKDKNVINRFQGLQPQNLLNIYLSYVSEDAYLTKDWFEYSNQK